MAKRTEIHVDGHCGEAGKIIKNAQERDSTALNHFAHGSVDSHGSDFSRSAGLAAAIPPPTEDSIAKHTGKKEWDMAKLATEIPKLHMVFEKTIIELLQQEGTKALRRSEATMEQIEEFPLEQTMRERALMNMLTILLFRNHLLLRWEGSHP